MLSRRVAEETTLYEELIRRGLPADYARRTADELEDHRVDLLADVLDERMADERIGETRGLAKQIARDYRRRSWFGRWPLVGFVLAQPAILLAFSVAVLLVLSGLEMLIRLLTLETPWTKPGVEFWMDVESANLYSWFFLALFSYAVPAAVALLIGWLALRTTQSRRWALLACLTLGMTSGLVIHKVRSNPDDPALGRAEIGVCVGYPALTTLKFYSRPRQLAQLMAPLLAGGLLLWGDQRRRHAALLTPELVAG